MQDTLNEQIKNLDIIDPPSKITKLKASIEWHRDKNSICLEEWLSNEELEIFTVNIKQKFLYRNWGEGVEYELEHLAKIVFTLSLNQEIFTGPFTVKVYNDISNSEATSLKFIVSPCNEFDEDEDE